MSVVTTPEHPGAGVASDSAPSPVPDAATGARAPSATQPAPGPQPSQAAPQTSWYGLPAVIGEALALPLVSDMRTAGIAASGYALWPAFVHLRQDRLGPALASIALRLVIPGLAGLAAVNSNSCRDANLTCAGPTLIVSVLGVAGAITLDNKLSRAPVRATPAPLRVGVMGGVIAGVGGKAMPAVTASVESDSETTPMTFSYQIAGAFGHQLAPDGSSADVQSGAARLLLGWRVVESQRAFLAFGTLLGARGARAVRPYPYAGHPDEEVGAELGATLSFRARFSSRLVVGAGLLGYRLLSTGSDWHGGIMPGWLAELQAGVGWQLL